VAKTGKNTGGTTAAGNATRDQQPITGVDLDLVGDMVVRGNLTLRGSGLDRRIGIAHADANQTVSATSYTDLTGLTLTITVPPTGEFELVGSLPLLIEEAIAGQAAVASGARSSGTVTMNTSAAHGFTTGEIVTVTVADTTYNGTYVVTVTDADTFTYSQSALGNDASSGVGVAGKAGNPGAGADIALTLADNTVITTDSTPRAVTGNQVMSFFIRAPIPCSTHAPAAGTEVTYKLRMRTTHATSDASTFVTFVGPVNIAYLEALSA
jgi:hypothetical protein